MVSTTPTGVTQSYIKAYDVAAQVVIAARIADGWDTITLDYIYDVVGARDAAAKTSARYAVRVAKRDGSITSTGTDGVYAVA